MELIDKEKLIEHITEIMEINGLLDESTIMIYEIKDLINDQPTVNTMNNLKRYAFEIDSLTSELLRKHRIRYMGWRKYAFIDALITMSGRRNLLDIAHWLTEEYKESEGE